MALHHNPRIVTDGLVLALDAGDVNSYPGTGTTLYNLADKVSYPSMALAGTVASGSIGNGVVSIAGQDGNFNQGAYLRGPGDLATTVNSDFTSMGWLYRETDDSGEVLSYRETSTRLSFDINNNQMIFWQRETVSPFTQRNTSVSVANNLNTWYYYALSRAGDSFSFYRNGELIGTNTFTLSETITPSSWYHSGIAWSDDDYTNRGMDGKIGPIQHYTRALTPQEVLQNYNATKTRFGL